MQKIMRTNRSPYNFQCVQISNNDCYASAVCDAAEWVTPRGLDTSRPLSRRPRVCGAGGNKPCGGWLRPAPCLVSSSDKGLRNRYSRFNPNRDTAYMNSRIVGNNVFKQCLKKNKREKRQGPRRKKQKRQKANLLKEKKRQKAKLLEGTHTMRGPVGCYWQGWFLQFPVSSSTLNVSQPPPPPPLLLFQHHDISN